MQHCNIAPLLIVNIATLLMSQRCSVLVGPDLRAGRFMACTVTFLGRLADPPLPHSFARIALAKDTRRPSLPSGEQLTSGE